MQIKIHSRGRGDYMSSDSIRALDEFVQETQYSASDPKFAGNVLRARMLT